MEEVLGISGEIIPADAKKPGDGRLKAAESLLAMIYREKWSWIPDWTTACESGMNEK